MPRNFANPPPTPNDIILADAKFPNPFNAGIRVGNVMVVGGTAALDEKGGARFPGDLPLQSRECMDYLKRVVIDLDGTMDDVVSLSNYFGTLKGWSKGVAVEAGYFGRGTTSTGLVSGTITDTGPMFFDSSLVLEAELMAIAGEPKRFADPPKHYAALGGQKFHQGMRCGNIVIVAGQMALNRRGDVLSEGDMPAQTHLAMENVERVLQELGAHMRDLVSIRTYHVGEVGWDQAKAARAEHLDSGPADTSVKVASLLLPHALIQIEAVAIVGASKEYSDPSGLPPVDAPFHQGVRCESMIFVGAQGSVDSNGRVLHAGDVVRQTSVAMDNQKSVIEGLGAQMDDVVQHHTYYSGRADLRDTLPIRASYFKPGLGPVTRGVVVAGLCHPDMRIAFETMAIVDD